MTKEEVQENNEMTEAIKRKFGGKYEEYRQRVIESAPEEIKNISYTGLTAMRNSYTLHAEKHIDNDKKRRDYMSLAIQLQIIIDHKMQQDGLTKN